jgi:hypothetical protein
MVNVISVKQSLMEQTSSATTMHHMQEELSPILVMGSLTKAISILTTLLRFGTKQ